MVEVEFQRNLGMVSPKSPAGDSSSALLRPEDQAKDHWGRSPSLQGLFPDDRQGQDRTVRINGPLVVGSYCTSHAPLGADHVDHQLDPSSDPVVADATNFLQLSLLPNKREPHQKTSVE